MLYEMVDRICKQLEERQFSANDLGELAGQIREFGLEILPTVFQDPVATEDSDGPAAQVLALYVIGTLKAIPRVARQLAARSKDGKTPVATRCAIAGVLAYFVQPHDFFRDDAPAGYGFIDDAVYLFAGELEFARSRSMPASEVESARNRIALLIRLMPSNVRPILQQSVATMGLGIQMMSMLDADTAEFLLQTLIANPLQPVAPPTPQNFTPHATPNYAQGRWSGLAYFEGDNVIITGGPSLIDGKLFIP